MKLPLDEVNLELLRARETEGMSVMYNWGGKEI